MLGALSGLSLAACAAVESPASDTAQHPPPSPPAITRHAEHTSEAIRNETSRRLTSVTWRLVEIQSMDDAIGITRPERPSRYTMVFNKDGSAEFRLNCNQGSTTWSAAPTSESSGQIGFANTAMTRALCPPPSLDVRIARDLEYVRSYFLKDEKLYLSLMADGGIYVWEPNIPKLLPDSTKTSPAR